MTSTHEASLVDCRNGFDKSSTPHRQLGVMIPQQQQKRPFKRLNFEQVRHKIYHTRDGAQSNVFDDIECHFYLRRIRDINRSIARAKRERRFIL
jgi:hypothetical protein